MKIAVLGRFRSNSANGIDRTIDGHVRQLARRGHQVTVVSFEPPVSEDRAELVRIGVRFILLPTSPLRLPAAILRLRDHGFDLLWLHSVFIFRNWLVARLLGCEWVTTPNGGYSPGQIEFKSRFLKRCALSLFERGLLEQALCVHVVSETEAEQVRRVAPLANAVVAPNGCDSSLMNVLPVADRGEELRLLFVGRVAWMHKGLDLLFQALAGIGSPRRWRLDIVGPGSEDQIAHLTELLGGREMKKNIMFHGAKYGAEKLQFLENCHVFVHPSRWEGMPFAIIEALQLGRPVLVTPGTNMSQLVEEYDAGWAVDEDSLSDGLLTLMQASDVVLRAKAGNAAALAREALSWNAIGDSLFGRVEKLLNAPVMPSARASSF